MAEVHRLGNQVGDPSTESVIAMLEDALRHLRSGEAVFPYRKALLLLLDDNESELGAMYNFDWFQSGMLMSECIALTRIVEHSFLSKMDYAVLPEDLPEQ